MLLDLEREPTIEDEVQICCIVFENLLMKTDISINLELLKYGDKRLYQYNEDDFRIQFRYKLLNIMDTQKHRSPENLSIKKLLFHYL